MSMFSTTTKMEREEFAQFLGKVITLNNIMNRNKMPKEKYFL
jgi:hypothetical protein